MTAEASTPLRLSFVYPQLKRLTGAQRLILQLAAAVAEDGHRVTLVTHRLADACRSALAPAVEVIETGQRVDWTGRHLVDSFLEYLLGLRLVARLPAPLDAVVFFGPPSLPALALARRRLAVPLISFCYEPPRFAYADQASLRDRLGLAGPIIAAGLRLYRPVDRWLMRRADLIGANGRFGASEIARVYHRPALVLDHGVALPEDVEVSRGDLNARYDLDDAPVLLTVNHLHPRKRLDLFLEALARVVETRPDALGVLVGDGVDRPRLEELAARLGVEKSVRWTGHAPEADLVALYRRASVYLHTGRQETFGLSVLEATAMGVPVVAVDEGGPRDILEQGALGRLVPPDAAALAEAALRSLADPAATDLAQRAAGRVRARYRWSVGAATLIVAVRALRAGHDEAAAIKLVTSGATRGHANI